MARATTTNQQITGTYSTQKNQTRFSMAGWINRASAGSQQIFAFSDSTSHYLGPYHFSDNVMYFLCANGSSAYGSSSQNVTGWNHWAMAFDGSQTGNANRLKAWLNGTALTLSFFGTIPAATSNNSAVDVFRIGRSQYAAAWAPGSYAEIGMWQGVLTDSDAASLAKGISPHKIRPDVLVSHVPLIRDVVDIKSGVTLTDTSTTAAAHPRIYK